ncbi:hypothetical protein [Nocardioides stalactiti]|uniref:hypothetical protein n=1 Tax=Nocardioides stalactiti TaxID=2755356 RepID=UPI0016025BC9|nr:hypothetical protein [Nocardioides stalactiti]
MRARGARSAVLAGVVAVALATGGLAYGSAADGDEGTAGVSVATGTPVDKGDATGTAKIKPKPGVKPSKSVAPGSTAEKNPVIRSRTTGARVVDKSDKGKKNVRPTKDGGRKNAPITRG